MGGNGLLLLVLGGEWGKGLHFGGGEGKARDLFIIIGFGLGRLDIYYCFYDLVNDLISS